MSIIEADISRGERMSWLGNPPTEARPSYVNPNSWHGTDAKIYEWVKATVNCLRSEAEAVGCAAPRMQVWCSRVDGHEVLTIRFLMDASPRLDRMRTTSRAETDIGTISIHVDPDLDRIVFDADGQVDKKGTPSAGIHAPTALDAFLIASLVAFYLKWSVDWGCREDHLPFPVHPADDDMAIVIPGPRPAWLAGGVMEALPSHVGPDGWRGTDRKIHEWVRSTSDGLRSAARNGGYEAPHFCVWCYLVDGSESFAVFFEGRPDARLSSDANAPIEDHSLGSIDLHVVPELRTIVSTRSARYESDCGYVREELYLPTVSDAFLVASLLAFELKWPGEWGCREIHLPFPVWP